MNRKIKLCVISVLSIVTLVGAFSVATPAYAMTCHSATLTGTVDTGTPPTRARFTYGTSYSQVQSGAGIPTTVQTFNTQGSFPIQQYIDGLSESTTYYYRLEVTNNYGTSYLNINNFQTPACPVSAPTATISANPSNVANGGSSAITWSSQNATSCNATGGSSNWAGTVGTGGTFYANNLTSTTTYSINCTGPGGTSPTQSATVIVNSLPDPIVSISANQTRIPYNTGTTITWSSQYASSCIANGGSAGWAGNKNLNGSSYTGNLTASTTYSITCQNSAGKSASDSVTITVDPQIQAPTASISADNTNLSYGGSTIIRWSSQYATSCTATGGANSWGGSINTSGSQSTGSLTSTVTYGITCYNSAGQSASNSVTVNVSRQPNPTVSVTISANPSSVQYGGSSTITWSSLSASSCVAYGNGTNWGGSKGTGGSFNTGALTADTNYGITCYGSNGQSASQSVTVSVGPQSNPTVALSANPTSVQYNGTSTINWTSQNATYCSFTGGTNAPSGKQNTYGSFNSGNLKSGTTYSINCYNSTGAVAYDSVTVTVGNQPVATGTLTVSPVSCTIQSGQSTCTVNASWSTQNENNVSVVDGNTGNVLSTSPNSSYQTVWVAYPSTTYYLKNNGVTLDQKTANASCAYGTSWQNGACQTNIINKPVVNLIANPISVQYNGTSNISWNSQYASYCIFTSGTNAPSGHQSTSGSFNTGALTQGTTYGINCYGSTGAVGYDSVTVTVGNQPVATGTLTVSPVSCTIQSGQSTCTVNASWSTQNENNVSVVDGNTGNVLSTSPNSSYQTVWVAYPSTTYYLKNNGVTLDQKTANASCAYGTSWNGTACMTNVPNNPTVTITANPTSVQYNGTSTINWTSQNASYCSFTGGTNAPNGQQSISGSFNTGALTQSTTYNINCYGSTGAVAYGSATVNVGNQPIATGTLTVSPTSCTIPTGASTCTVNASWNTQNANSVTVVDGNTGNTLSSQANGNITAWVAYPSTIYYLKNSGSVLDSKVATSSCAYGTTWNGTACMTNVPNNPTVTITANPTTVDYGNSSTLNWNSQNATYCTGSGGNWSGNKPMSGSASTGALYQTSTFTITCGGSSGAVATNSVTVYVNQQNNPVSVNITADNTNLNNNGSTTVRWTSQNATSCSASGGTNGWSGSRGTSGSFNTGTLYGTTTYSISCQNSSGQSASSSVTIYTNNNNNTTPTVSTQNASNVDYGSATLNGYVTSNGGNNTTAWFQWGTNSNFYNQTNQNSYGSTGGTSFTYYLSGLAPNTTYYYRAVAQGDSGQIVYGNQISFTTNNNGNCNYYNNYGNCNNNNQLYVSTYSATGVTDTSATLNGYISTSGYSYNNYVSRWFEWGPNGYLNNRTNETSQYSGGGNFNQSIYSLSPNTTYRYRAAARDSNGNVVYGNTYTFTTTGSYINPGDCSTTGTCAPTAITMPASNIGQTSATLNGTAVIGSNVNASTTGYFEYGTTQSLGLTTNSQPMGNVSSVPFFSGVSGLAPNTTYYFRAVVVNSYGTSRGTIYTFRTGSTIVYTNDTGSNTVYRYTTVVSNTSSNTSSVTGGTAQPSLVFLSISTNTQIIYKGDTVSYIIYYKNVSTENLTNVLLRVALPKELEWRSTSLGTYSAQNNMVIANIGNLAPQQEGSIQVTVLVLDSAVTGKNVVVTADLAYTIQRTGDQQEVFAYLENLVEDRGVSLGAAAIFGTGFLPATLLGWLLLILLILLLVAAIRWLYERSAYGSAAVIVAPPSGEHHA